MHRIEFSYRSILPAEIPTIAPIGEDTRAMTDAELLNMGIVRIDGDIFSCVSQQQRDPETFMWAPVEGQSLPGTVISQGLLRERHAKLPSEVRSRVMRASVIRSTVEGTTAKEAAAGNLLELGAVLSETVGLVDGEPLVDTTSPEAELVEALRLAGIPDSGLERATVPMGDVTDGDFVEADELVPHSWAGEPKR